MLHVYQKKGGKGGGRQVLFVEVVQSMRVKVLRRALGLSCAQAEYRAAPGSTLEELSSGLFLYLEERDLVFRVAHRGDLVNVVGMGNIPDLEAISVTE